MNSILKIAAGVVLGILVLFVGCAALVAPGVNKASDDFDRASDDFDRAMDDLDRAVDGSNCYGARCITLDEFGRIGAGMTYPEVAAIIGSDGTIETDSTSPRGDGTQLRTVSYRWDATGMVGANASVMFQGPPGAETVTLTAQFGAE